MSVWSQVKVVDMGTHALVSICRNACVALNVGLIPKTYAKGDFDFFPWCLLALAEKTLDSLGLYYFQNLFKQNFNFNKDTDHTLRLTFESLSPHAQSPEVNSETREKLKWLLFLLHLLYVKSKES